jgi:hypothetical protein
MVKAMARSLVLPTAWSVGASGGPLGRVARKPARGERPQEQSRRCPKANPAGQHGPLITVVPFMPKYPRVNSLPRHWPLFVSARRGSEMVHRIDSYGHRTQSWGSLVSHLARRAPSRADTGPREKRMSLGTHAKHISNMIEYNEEPCITRWRIGQTGCKLILNWNPIMGLGKIICSSSGCGGNSWGGHQASDRDRTPPLMSLRSLALVRGGTG